MTIAKKIAKNNSNVDTANNTVISMTQYKDLLAWAEKVSNGQLDAATQIKTHCATWLNADIDKNTVIDIIKADDLNGLRNFLAQFNFAVKDDAGYIHKLYTYENGDCVLAEMPTSESATTNTEVKEPDDEDREKFLRAKEEIKTTAGRYLGDGKFAQIWQRNNGFGWRNIAKKNAALILAEYGLTVDEYLAAQKQWVAEGVARSALGAAAEDFAAAIIAPAKVLALPAPVETVTGRLKATQERGDREFTFPTVEELTKPEIGTATKENNANELPTGKITVKSGTEAWAIVGKHFPKDNLEFCRAGKGFNNEDTFCYTLDEIIYVHATCTPDNKRVECIEIVNTYEESESERNILTVYINHDAATESAMEDARAKFVAGQIYRNMDWSTFGPADKVYKIVKRTAKYVYIATYSEYYGKWVGGDDKELDRYYIRENNEGEYVNYWDGKRICAQFNDAELIDEPEVEVDKSATAKFEAGKTYFEFWYEDTGLKHKQVYTVEKRTDKTITVGGKRYKIFLSDYGDGEYARVSYTKRVYAKNIYTELEVDKSATADSLTRAMTTALEHYQDFCRVGNLTAATNEWSLYNICRKAMSELWKEEAA